MEALELPRIEQEVFVAGAAGDDAELFREIMEMLAGEVDPDFMDPAQLEVPPPESTEPRLRIASWATP